MRRRGGSEQPVKGRRANRAGKVLIAAPSIADLQDQVGTLARELKEAREQQTATAEVLQVINSSPGNLAPVFDAMLEKAMSLCEASFGSLWTLDGDRFHPVAHRGLPARYAEYLRRDVPTAGTGTGRARLLAGDSFAHIANLADDEPYRTGEPHRRALVDLGGARTALLVPLRRDDTVSGLIMIYRQEVRPFMDKQIALLQTFAAQAVIAMENARLLGELRQRSDDLSESLEQQTATSEVLKVISSSPGDLKEIFSIMLAIAMRICDASYCGLFLRHGDGMRLAAQCRLPKALQDFLHEHDVYAPPANSPVGHIVQTKQLLHSPDIAAETGIRAPSALLGGARAYLGIPMLKENDLVGVIAVYRRKVRPFTDKQIALVQNFAAQAVIAIENAGLLKELRERTDQLEVQSQEVIKLNQQLEQRVADQVGEIERMSRLRRFLPPQVADLIVASGTEKQLESHRREITALFCDLRGFTGFSEASAPEDVMALLRDYHAAIGEIIIKYSGTLERYAGDGVMVVFNDPVLVDNPALRAVLMALETREAMGALMEKWRQLGHDVGFGIGIAHGFATLGTIGFEGRFDYAAIGTVSNVASRLCDEAKPGQILVSPRVFTAVKDAVTVEPMGEFMLKGIGRPLAAYNVLGTTKPAN